LSEKEDAMVKQQFDATEARRVELQEKGSKMEEQLRGETAEKDVLVGRKVALEEDILQLEKEYHRISAEIDKTEDWKQEVKKAEQGLKEKKQEYDCQKQQCQTEKQTLAQRLKEEQEAIGALKNQCEAYQAENQGQKQLIKQAELSQELCVQKMATLATVKASASEDNWMLEEQTQTFALLESMLKAVKVQTEKVESEESSCQTKIKEA
jgi:chromosome segregation ATPase